ncbi:phage tail protein [Paraburkholderia hospita]|uniref:phage tail protein n=1 Tax=Paraburkholderia hospita TaxID=169430 RepID=UPI003ED02A4A
MPASGSRHDPLTSFNFIITVENMRAGFSEVSGLATETDIIEYREGNEDISVRKIPGKRKYTNISLKRGYTADGKDLWAWRKTVMDGKTVRKGGTITLLNEARQPALTWEFSEGWPSKWAGPAMNAKNNDIAIEEFEICIEGLTLQT